MSNLALSSCGHTSLCFICHIASGTLEHMLLFYVLFSLKSSMDISLLSMIFLLFLFGETLCSLALLLNMIGSLSFILIILTTWHI